MGTNKGFEPQNAASKIIRMIWSRLTRRLPSIRRKHCGHFWCCAIRYVGTFLQCPWNYIWQTKICMLIRIHWINYRLAQHLPWSPIMWRQQSSRQPISWATRLDRTSHAHAVGQTSVVWWNLGEERLIITAIREHYFIELQIYLGWREVRLYLRSISRATEGVVSILTAGLADYACGYTRLTYLVGHSELTIYPQITARQWWWHRYFCLGHWPCLLQGSRVKPTATWPPYLYYIAFWRQSEACILWLKGHTSQSSCDPRAGSVTLAWQEVKARGQRGTKVSLSVFWHWFQAMSVAWLPWLLA